MAKKDTLTIQRTINFALLTSEYQTAKEVAKLLKLLVVPEFYPLLDARVAELETLSRQELMLATSVFTHNTDLGTTPIYPEPAMDELTRRYSLALTNYYGERSGTGLRDIALFRRQSDVLYSLNAPVFRIHQFLRHPEYLALVTDKEALADVGNEDAIKYLTKLHETLMHVFLLPSSKLSDIKGWNPELFDIEAIDTLELEDAII